MSKTRPQPKTQPQARPTPKPSTRKALVTRYSALILAAERAWDTELADRLLAERNTLLS